MFGASNMDYELAGRTEAMPCGGLGAIHLLAQRIGLVEDLDHSLALLKVPLPDHESDHVLHLAYNIRAGGQRFEDLEHRRQDASYLNGLGGPAHARSHHRRRLCAPVHPGLDYRPAGVPQPRAPVVWGVQPAGFLAEAFIDVDGTIAGTDGECKAGMGLSYKGIWGYAPLIVSLAHTQEVLYLLNRPGNVFRHSESVG